MRSFTQMCLVVFVLVAGLFPVEMSADTVLSSNLAVRNQQLARMSPAMREMYKQRFLEECRNEKAPYQDTKPGQYGNSHCLDHKWGAVARLAYLSGGSCCDGVGECRATHVKPVLDEAGALVHQVKIEKNWQSLNNHKIYSTAEVDLPPGQNAMVCASRFNGKDQGGVSENYSIYCGVVIRSPDV